MIWRRFVAIALVICLMDLGLPPRAHAEMISTDAVVSGDVRNPIMSVFNRAEVRMELANLGVSSADLSARVSALTDHEAAQIARQLDQLPAAGGDPAGMLIVLAILAAIAFVLVVVAAFKR